MTIVTLITIQVAMAMTLFVIGAAAFAVGVIVLVTRSTGREVRSLAAQTAQLTQKGLAEDVVGLVGNASALLTATSELVRTTAGIGVFLTLLGVILMAISGWLVLQVG